MRIAWLYEPMTVDAGDLDDVAERRRVHHLAVADVDADVAHRAVEEARSPGCSSERETCVPICDCMALECGRLMPAAA